MPRTTEYTQFVALPPRRLWAVLGDPARWPEWNPAVSAVTLRGAPGMGTVGDYLPRGRVMAAVHGRLARPFTIVAFDAERELTIEQPEPAGSLRISWTLAPQGGGTLLTQRIGLTGPSAPVYRPVIGRGLQADTRVNIARSALLAGTTPGAEALTVIIAGGSGALGRAVAADLTCRGHRVIVLTRRPDPALPFTQQQWDGRRLDDRFAALCEPRRTAVINLAGKLVDCRPTTRNIAELRRSRVDSTTALIEAVRTLDRPVEYWIQASTTAIWSDAGETRCTESTPLPTGLPQMTGVAEPWERAFDPTVARHWTILRTSIVLDADAPALRRLAGLTRAGLGGRVGPGDQWFSWIHVEDWLALVRAALGLDPAVRLPDGILVAATDFPVRNRELMAALRRRLHRPPAPPTPAAMLRAGAIVLRTDPALGLTGRHATSEVLPHTGFRFRYPTLDEALGNLFPH